MSIDVLVIGAGQAGLAAAWHLQRAGVPFRIVEASTQVGGSWRHYYDSLTLFSPAGYSSLPGMPFPGDPERYPVRDEVTGYLEAYAARYELPVEFGRRVASVGRLDAGFASKLADGEIIHSRAVVAASGAFARPYMPPIDGLESFRGRVLHAAQYRSPEGFEGQRIVVVGGANSAVQIAAELASRATVTLASRRPIRFAPQRVLGKDFHFWLNLTGLDRTRWLDDQSTPVLDTGKYRGAIKSGHPDQRGMFLKVDSTGVEWSPGQHEPVDVLLFATGYRPQVPYLDSLGAIDAEGRLLQRKGVSTTVPGLYYVGFPKQRNFASATLRGVGPDAEVVVRSLRAQLAPGTSRHQREHRRICCEPAT
ncbi:monooxygenase [Solimonas fluminis]|jgi:putative flavoprotein involved in K+ transport|uniref:Monooxygenase n=1 Tax=Solimonas fluminis TaxID=2086571 RepID=A0A2S5TCK9_9GAMM|nr:MULTISPECIES: NAD(P)-binding domain-containing protein [Solimonas]MDM4771366.1 NAD(P)-binding domain-containing protein [Solimonas sp. SE-A11]PPE72744.1 monooxygenase [Solimonas fluminis]